MVFVVRLLKCDFISLRGCPPSNGILAVLGESPGQVMTRQHLCRWLYMMSSLAFLAYGLLVDIDCVGPKVFMSARKSQMMEDRILILQSEKD